MAPSPGDHREERVRGLIEPDANMSVVGHAALLVQVWSTASTPTVPPTQRGSRANTMIAAAAAFISAR